MIHNHHRQLRRGGDDSPVNVIGLPDVIHEWVHANPEKAREAGLIVSQYEDPATVQVTIPEEALRKVRQKREKTEKPRNRTNVTVNVPKDEREDGAGLLEDRIDRGRELLCEPMGWDEDVPAYFVLIAVMDKGLEAIDYELRVEAQEGDELRHFVDELSTDDDVQLP